MLGAEFRTSEAPSLEAAPQFPKHGLIQSDLTAPEDPVRKTSEFRQRLPMPRMRSATARADCNSVCNGNVESGHDSRICNALEQWLNLSRVCFYVSSLIQAGRSAGFHADLARACFRWVAAIRVLGSTACAATRPARAISTMRSRTRSLSHTSHCFRPFDIDVPQEPQTLSGAGAGLASGIAALPFASRFFACVNLVGRGASSPEIVDENARNPFRDRGDRSPPSLSRFRQLRGK
jgi:hypothetical protein